MIISAIIPARYNSSRFPGKPLATIIGKPMIQHVYEAVLSTNLFREVWVATDHPDIFSCVESFSGKVRLTRQDHVSGTDRVWEVASEIEADAVVNIQGDEPLIDKVVLQGICQALAENESVVTAAFFSENQEWYSSPDHVKVVVDSQNYALYFSRAGIPFNRESSSTAFWHHIGIYGYQKAALNRFVLLKRSSLEEKEALEQLRLLENGFKIKVVETCYCGFGVDRPCDLLLAEELMIKRSARHDCS